MFGPKNHSNTNSYSVAPALQHCIAKTITVQNTSPHSILGIDVLTHCIIVGAVAGELVKLFPPVIIEELFPPGVELIAASHDVGKINPHFQEKIRRALADEYSNNSFPGLENAQPDLESGFGRHEGASQSALEGKGSYIPHIVGAHHGVSHSSTKIRSANAEVLGGEAWQERRMELLEKLEEQLQTHWPEIKTDLQAMVITGLTIVSDWIGSNQDFDYFQFESAEKLQASVQNALKKAGFHKLVIRKNLQFNNVFSFEPRILQKKILDFPIRAGIYIVEDEMGQGKTEAALALAYKMLEKGIAFGIYFALPTKLSSEKLYDRFTDFLSRIVKLDNDNIPLRAHGNSWLYEGEMGEDGSPGKSWFSPKKRRLLAPFAIGTIDQALMAVLKVKHSTVRTFGLAGKVVILDEVHSYDSYTGTIMDTLISSLYKLGCPVIVLSATLQNTRKKEILEKCGCSPRISIPDHYPQISVFNDTGNFSATAPIPRDQKNIAIRLEHQRRLAIEDVLQKAESGQYVLWIENTVYDSQTVYKLLSARAHSMDIQVGLLHSRFTPVDRRNNEENWVDKFGKERRGYISGRGMILVGTQVLEQSLDIDADYLVTQLAPSDMLLQRIGRLWRHTSISTRNMRSGEAVPEVCILTPEQSEILNSPKTAFAKSGKVYSPYVLYRTYMLWEHMRNITIPQDIRSVIQKTYVEEEEHGEFRMLLNELQAEKEKLQQFANVGMAKLGSTQTDSDIFAPTRYSDIETIDVLALKKCISGNGHVQLILFDGTPLSIPKLVYESQTERQEKARCLHRNIFSVPKHYITLRYSTQELCWLSSYIYLGESDSREALVVPVVVQDSERLTGIRGEGVHNKNILRYNSVLGFTSDD